MSRKHNKETVEIKMTYYHATCIFKIHKFIFKSSKIHSYFLFILISLIKYILFLLFIFYPKKIIHYKIYILSIFLFASSKIIFSIKRKLVVGLKSYKNMLKKNLRDGGGWGGRVDGLLCWGDGSMKSEERLG